ncbi:rod shape-determining protein MreD, partial [Klebsiella oxytoca]
MKRVIVDIVFVLVCFVLQCTVFQSWAMADISPNLLIVVVSSVGFMRGKTEGMLMGFFSGLLIDI